jgi:hypothetical protein
LFIQAQQILLSCTQFAAELVKTAKANEDMISICERMKELEQFVEGVTREADTWILQGWPTSPLETTEEVVSRALRCMARIKLNRYDRCITKNQQLTVEVRGLKYTGTVRFMTTPCSWVNIVIWTRNHPPVQPLL